MDSLNLSTPLQHDYSDPTVERDVLRLRDWLSNLPLMDVVETVRLVLGALDSLNGQKLAAPLRFDCLEEYRTTAHRLFQTVDPLNLAHLVLSRAQRQEAIDGAMQVFLSLADGYKLLVKALHEQPGGESGQALFGMSVNRAMEQLVYALLDSYRFYREIPPQLVAELHTLYRLARRHGILGVSPRPDASQVPVTTAMLYHAIMLLSLTDTERLAEGEAGLIFDVLLQLADRCSIIPGNSWEGNGEGMYLIELQEGKLPVPCTQFRPPVDIQDPYLLDARGILQAIADQPPRISEKGYMESPEALLLRRLLAADSTARRRREQRYKDGRAVELLSGLEAIHAFVRRVMERRRDPAARRDELLQCRVLDSSASGMKLSWEEGVVGDARVGDLLGLVEDEGGRKTLRLGIFRSIHVYREGGIETGVQMLAGLPGAVSCSLPEQPGADAVHVLFMPADEKQQFATTLIAPKGLYVHGRAMLINAGGRELAVRAGRRVLDSPVFDRFEFSVQ